MKSTSPATETKDASNAANLSSGVELDRRASSGCVHSLQKGKCKTLSFGGTKSRENHCSGAASRIRRTLSADTIYISESDQSNQWSASLHTYCGKLMMHRSTQTPWEWEEMDSQRNIDRKMCKKTNETIDMIVKNATNKRTGKAKNGNGTAVNSSQTCTSSTSSPSKINNVLASSSPQHQNQQRTAKPPQSGPIPIPAKNRQLSPISAEIMNNRSLGRNSVEELNQEIERLVLEGILGNSSDPPEGHRAPIAELFTSQNRRTAKTQTPSSVDSAESSRCTSDDSSCPSSAEHSRPESPVSPVHIVDRRSKRRSNVKANYGTSPEINKFLTREPPDGCEKVKIVNEEEARKKCNLSHVVLAPCPQKPANPGFVLLPSQSSAFLPLYKNNYCVKSASPDSLTATFNQIYEKRMNEMNNSKSHLK